MLTGAINLCQNGNVQGVYYYFSLNTGHHINRNKWTVVTITQWAIDHIHHMSHRQTPPHQIPR